MRKNRLHTVILLILVLFVSAIIAPWINDHRQAVSAETPTNCVIKVDGVANAGPTPVPISPSLHQLSLYVPLSMAAQVQSVEFNLGGTTKKIGRAKLDASNSTAWTMPWYAQLTSTLGVSGTQQHITASTGGITCSVQPFVFTMTTATNAHLEVFSNPSGFSGTTNEAVNFALISKVGDATTGPDVSAYTFFEKLPQTLGSVSPLDYGNFFRFSAGPAAGNGKITVIARYGGVESMLSIPVSILVQSSNTATTTTNPTTGTQTTNATNTNTTSTTPSVSTAALSIESEPVTKNCVTTKLTAERYLAISKGLSRPTAQEFEAINDCFANRNYVLPSGFVPVAAEKVKSQPVTNDIRITGAVNEISPDKTTDVTKIKFSGKGKPGTTVLIYVFSEPLVLSAKTDQSGDWSYTLEDPLEPGTHEAYAMVDKGDGTYTRSNAFGFAVASVDASPSNPNGYSLKIQSTQATATEDSIPLNLYMGSVGLLIALVIGVSYYIFVHKKRLSINNITSVPAADMSSGTSPEPPQAPVENTEVKQANDVAPVNPVTSETPVKPAEDDTEPKE